MTEISNIKGGGQVISLNTPNVKSPESNGISRFSTNGNAAQAVEIAPVSNAKPAESLQPGQDPLEKVARVIEKLVPDEGPNTKLRIDKDEETGRFIYKNVDTESGEVVSQFPPETILEIISQYRSIEGLIVDDDA